MRWIAVAACVLVSACGGGSEPDEPRLEPALAEDLAARNDAVAAALERGDDCAADALAAQLQQRVVAAVNAGRVPPELQEELTGSANELAESIECDAGG